MLESNIVDYMITNVCYYFWYYYHLVATLHIIMFFSLFFLLWYHGTEMYTIEKINEVHKE